MKISFKSLLLAAPGVFLIGCGPAKKPPVAQVSSEQSPAPAAASSPADSSVASAAPADSAGGGGGGQRQRWGGGGRGGRGGGNGGGGGGDRGAERMQRMTTALSLTPDQSEKIKAIMEAQRPAADAIRNDTTLSNEDRRAKLQELRKTTEPQIQAILTPEQKTKWEELRSQAGNRQGGGGGGRRGGGGNGGGTQPAPSPAN